MKTFGLDRLGRRTRNFISEFGEISRLAGRAVSFLPASRRDWNLVIEQMEHIGVGSLPLVLVIGLFTGMVSAWQAAYQLQGLISFTFIGAATSRAILVELGPVLTGVVIAGRVGASIAAEIGTMKVTEQIDALETMAINPVRYLAMPRIFAAIMMMPVLVVFADVIAIWGSFLVSSFFLHLSASTFFGSVQRFFHVKDVVAGLVKSTVFGGVTALLGCHIGFRTGGGAEGVGMATIRSFVLSSALILILDFVLWQIIY